MKAGDRVVQLDCHVTHQFHETCYNNFINHLNSMGGNLKLCPLCRVTINEETVIKKILVRETADVKDMFGLKEVEPVVDTLPMPHSVAPQDMRPSDAGLVQPSQHPLNEFAHLDQPPPPQYVNQPPQVYPPGGMALAPAP